MPTVKTPLTLLTVRRISALTGKPVSVVRRVLDEHPEIMPTAVADCRPVYDRDAYLLLHAILSGTDQKPEVVPC